MEDDYWVEMEDDYWAKCGGKSKRALELIDLLPPVEFQEADVFGKRVSSLTYEDFVKYDAFLRLARGRFLTLVLNDGGLSFVVGQLPIQNKKVS